MARRYVVDSKIRRVNKITSWMARRGIGRTEVLVTVGRRSGEARSVPISPIAVDGIEYLVGPYGERGWVKNVRSDPRATLRRGRRSRKVVLTEVTGSTGAPVVAAYHAREGFARKFMDVSESADLGEFEAKAELFPVFRVDPGTASAV